MVSKKRAAVPPREDTRKALTKATGAKAVTFLNKCKLHEPLEKPAAKKRFAESTKRAAMYRAMREKRARTDRGKILAKKGC